MQPLVFLLLYNLDSGESNKIDFYSNITIL